MTEGCLWTKVEVCFVIRKGFWEGRGRDFLKLKTKKKGVSVVCWDLLPFLHFPSVAHDRI